MKKQGKMVYQLKITLAGIRPPIWRRVVVPADIRLGELHTVIQVLFGWTDSHLHAFAIGGEEYSTDCDDLDMKDERRVRLSSVVGEEKERFRYEYDFGDSWQHDVLVERILPSDPDASYPVCLTGKRAGPPEDCGGVWGYASLLEALSDPEHEDHEEMTGWAGGPIDPNAFDLERVNSILRSERA